MEMETSDRVLSATAVPWIDRNRLWIIILSSLLGLAIVISTFIACLLIMRQQLSKKEVDAKRSLPDPQPGSRMSFLVTDIEGYSSLMRWKPALMRDALITHNNLMLETKWQNYGSIVDQEGDSFVLVFREAFDAVSFALSAQKSLSEAQWPDGLHDPLLSPHWPMSLTSMSPASLLRAGREALMRSFKSGSSGQGTQGSPSASESRRVLQNPAVSRLLNPLSPRESPPRHSPGSIPHRATADIEAALINLVPAPLSAALHGLRVRMGIASGIVGLGSELRSNHIQALPRISAILQTADRCFFISAHLSL